MFSNAKIFISCSETEPFGMVFIEALLQGCLIVAPRSGGPLEIFSLLGECANDFFYFYDQEKDLHNKLEDAIRKYYSKDDLLYENSIKRRLTGDLSIGISTKLYGTFSPKIFSPNHYIRIPFSID